MIDDLKNYRADSFQLWENDSIPAALLFGLGVMLLIFWPYFT